MTASEQAAELVLKGGVLMALFAARRPTRDSDLAVSGFANEIAEVAEVEQRVRDIVEHELDDRLVFDRASIAGDPMQSSTAEPKAAAGTDPAIKS